MPLSPTTRRWLIRAAKLTILALLAWGVHRTFYDGFQALRERPLTVSPLWLLVSGALYLAAMLPVCLFWRRVLRVLGQPVPVGRAIRAYYVGGLGKYVPGKALVVVLRAGLVSGPGVDPAIAGATVFIETLTMMAAGSFLAAGLIAYHYHDRGLYVAGAVACMIVAGLPTLPPVFLRLLRLTKLGQATMSGGVAGPSGAAPQLDLARLDYGTLLLGWLGAGIGWLLNGLSLWAAAKAIGATTQGPLDALPAMTMLVSVSVVAGFISMIPGGLGAREAVLAELGRPQFGAEAAIVTLLLRLIWLAAELVAAAVLWPLGARRIARASPAGESKSPEP